MADCFFSKYVTGREIFLFLSSQERGEAGSTKMADGLALQMAQPICKSNSHSLLSLVLSLTAFSWKVKGHLQSLLECPRAEAAIPKACKTNSPHWLHLSDGQPIPQAFIHSSGTHSSIQPFNNRACSGDTVTARQTKHGTSYLQGTGSVGPDNKKTGNTAIHTFIRNIKNYIHTV